MSKIEAVVEGGCLVIRIGVAMLANAAEKSDLFCPFDESENRYMAHLRVSDDEVFARDVARELMREEEDGSTMLTRLLDIACERATEQGSEGVEEVGG